MKQIHQLYWYSKDPQKSPPTYSYFATKLANSLYEHKASYVKPVPDCSFGATTVRDIYKN